MHAWSSKHQKEKYNCRSNLILSLQTDTSNSHLSTTQGSHKPMTPQAGTSKSVHLPCPHLNHKEEKKHSVSRLVTRWNKTHGLDTYLGALGHPCRSGWEAQKKNREQLTHWWHMSDVLIQEPGLQGPDLPNTRTFRVQLIIIVSLSHSQMALCSLLLTRADIF